MDHLLKDEKGYVPDIKISSKQVFGIDFDIRTPAFSKSNPLVPKADKSYFFDNDTTKAILTGFAENKKGLDLPAGIAVLSLNYYGTMSQ